MRFRIAYGRTKLLLTLVGMPASAAYVDVTDDEVIVKMSWGFSATIPRSSIRGVRVLDTKVISIGVHGWRGKWLVNGAADRLVALDIDPAAKARTMFIPIKLTRLTLSLENREQFAAELT